MSREHTLARIEQFRREAAGNQELFEKKMLLRAQKSHPQKNELTAQILDEQGDPSLAQRIRMAQVLKDVQL